jgi:hypothetical protein
MNKITANLLESAHDPGSAYYHQHTSLQCEGRKEGDIRREEKGEGREKSGRKYFP